MKFTDETVKELLAGELPVVIDLWAEWCGPCRAIAPIVEELSTEYDGKVLIGKYNVDEESNLSGEYGVRSIPTLLFFKNGELVDKIVGASSKATMQEKIEKLIG